MIRSLTTTPPKFKKFKAQKKNIPKKKEYDNSHYISFLK